MHGFDTFEVAANEVIRSQNILGVVVPDIQKPVILPALRFFRSDAFCNLNVQFLVLPGGNEVNFAIGCFPDVHRIAPAAQFQINHILKACGSSFCRATVFRTLVSAMSIILRMSSKSNWLGNEDHESGAAKSKKGRNFWKSVVDFY